MKPEAKIYVNLGDGLCAEVIVRVIEEALPVPLEVATIREPGVTEMDAIATKLSAKDYRATPPFVFVRPSVPDIARPAPGNRTGGPKPPPLIPQARPS